MFSSLMWVPPQPQPQRLPGCPGSPTSLKSNGFSKASAGDVLYAKKPMPRHHPNLWLICHRLESLQPVPSHQYKWTTLDPFSTKRVSEESPQSAKDMWQFTSASLPRQSFSIWYAILWGPMGSRCQIYEDYYQKSNSVAR